MQPNQRKTTKNAKFEAMTKEGFYNWLHGADQIARDSRVPEDTKKYMNETAIPAVNNLQP